MSPKLRVTIAASIGVLLAFAGASDLADESFGLAGIVAVCALWIFFEWRAGARPEAWILSVILFGYIVGSRGFAQFQFSPSIPLLPAETALLLCTVGLGIRAALSKSLPIRIDAVNISILLWLGYATARMPWDLEDFGVMALRDYALAYYAVFFFLSQYLCRDPASMRLLDRAFTVSFLVLPFTALVDKVAPDFFNEYLTWNGIPLVYYKSDLISASLVCGSFWFWAKYTKTGTKFWLFPSAVSLLLVGAQESPRAALVATLAATAAWMCARRFRIVGFQAAVVAAGIAVSLPVEMFSGRPLIETKSYEMYERVVSLVDWTGSHSYQNSNSANTTDNNQFRRIWWKAVYDETMATNPVFGMGFGYDLAARFLAEYNWLAVEEEFTARSPHSILFTNLGRLGCAGLGLFLFALATMVRSASRSFSAVNIDEMAWWSIVITIGVSACFGVVLEGPMGAVVFWTALGVAHFKTNARTETPPAALP